ncbi:MAG TPA: hypothetical protein VNT30_25910 [Stellaceae bacterium]|nr:hypothetical protein [Stellaceae bacterium]
MTTGENFWDFFNAVVAPKLALREISFRKIFEYLDKFPPPITIVETGCARQQDNWSGDGQSTILFDRYVTSRGGGSKVYSVDINATAVEICKSQVSENASVYNEDSVVFLHQISNFFVKNKIQVNFVYLDSFDADLNYWFPSAAHHLKELLAVSRCMNSSTLLVVDDCPKNVHVFQEDGGQNKSLGEPLIAGKGKLIAEFAPKVGMDLLFSHYQAGWTGFNKET